MFNNISNIKLNNTIFQKLLNIIQTLNLMICLIVVGILLFSFNVKIFIFSNEVSTKSNILLVFIILFIAVAIYSLIIVVDYNVLSIMILGILTLFIYMNSINLILWFSSTIEGKLYIKGIKIIIIASFETKLNQYYYNIQNYLPLMSNGNNTLLKFLEQLSSIKNPDNYIIAKISFKITC